MISGNVSKTAADTVASLMMNVKSVQVQAPIKTSDSFKNVMDMSAGLTSGTPTDKSLPNGKANDIRNDVVAGTTAGTAADKITNAATSNGTSAKETDKSVVDELSENIESVIKDKLNMTDEEFADLMSQLGFTSLDLLNPQNLTDFVVAYSGAESSISLLTDSNLSDMYKSLTDSVMQVLTQTAEMVDMSVENLTAVVEQFNESDASEKTNNVFDQVAENTDQNSVKSEENVMTPVNSDDDDRNVRQNTESTETQSTTEKVTVKNDQSQVFDNEESDMKQSNGNDQGKDIMQNLVNSFSKAMETTNVAAQTPIIDAGSVISQIVDAVKVTATQQTTSMELQLQPENLGKVNIEVIAKDGAVTAKIVAENEAVKTVIENQITALKENMNNQGLKVEAVEVTVASHAFENGMNFENNSNSEQNSSTGTRRFRNFSELPDDDSAGTDTIQEQIQKANGGSVNYTA